MRDDPLVEGLFASPQPMMANVSGAEVLPKPDFVFIRRTLGLINQVRQAHRSIDAAVEGLGILRRQFHRAFQGEPSR